MTTIGPSILILQRDHPIQMIIYPHITQTRLFVSLARLLHAIACSNIAASSRLYLMPSLIIVPEQYKARYDNIWQTVLPDINYLCLTHPEEWNPAIKRQLWKTLQSWLQTIDQHDPNLSSNLS